VEALIITVYCSGFALLQMILGIYNSERQHCHVLLAVFECLI
jgi:hypothetical protein